jgi:2,4-dienoyl-CoA reductase-like NADH-dependent reductase (Old Yellow Enzyme family)
MKTLPDTTGLELDGHLQRLAALTAHRKDLQRRLMVLNMTIAIVRAKGSDRDWPEDFLHENGLYNRHCHRCNQTFLGNKHRLICKPCSSAIPHAVVEKIVLSTT